MRQKKNNKIYAISGEFGENTLTIVGVVSHEKEKHYVKTTNNNVESFEKKTVRKKILRIGYSIRHELDKNDENIGFKIALKRCFNRISYKSCSCS